MTPERERMFRQQMTVPTDSLDVRMWQTAIGEVFATLDAESAKVTKLRREIQDSLPDLVCRCGEDWTFRELHETHCVGYVAKGFIDVLEATDAH